MPLFEYSVLDVKGRKKEGFIEAASLPSARDRLKSDGFFVVSISSAAVASQRSTRSSSISLARFTRSDLASMTRQLATLLRAGLPLVQALEALVEQMEKPAVRKTLSSVRNLVNEGSAFHEALAEYPGIFPPMYIQMCRAGEAGGFLEQIMQRLAVTLEREARLRGRIIAAMIYPIVMTVVGTGLLTFLLVYVVPQIVSIFSEYGTNLPLPTRILLLVSGFLSNFWVYILLLIIGMYAGYRFLSRSRRFGVVVDGFKLRIPLIGKLNLKIAVVRLSHILGTLLASGVPLMRALDVVSDLVGNRILSSAVKQAGVSVSRGGSLAEAFRASGVFPPLLPRVVAVGEQSGELSGMLTSVAEAYEEEVGRAVQAMTAILEPVLILVMAAVVLSVVLAILLPILEMNDLVKGV